MEQTAKTGSVVVVVCMSLLILVFSASPALAHRGRVFGPSFGTPGSGAGQLALRSFTSEALIFGGSGLAANETTHDVYVADTGNDRVDEFTSTGTFIRAWGWGVENGASEFQVCTEATGCRAGLSGTSPGEFDTPAFVAVDNYPGGEGDVYVADYRKEGEPGNHLVQKFTAEGALIESWGSKGQVNEASVPAPEGLGTMGGVAVAPSGEVMVGTGGGIFEFDRISGAYIARVGGRNPRGEINTDLPDGLAIDGSGNIYYDKPSIARVSEYHVATEEFGIRFETHAYFPGIAVAKSGELYLDEGDTIQVIASSCVSLCTPDVTFSSPLLTDGAGLAVDSQSEVVYIAEVAGGKIESIVPEPPASPLVESQSQTVSDVSGDSATLEATISPRSEPNEEPTSYRFQYTTEGRFQQEGFDGASSIPVPDGQLAPSYEADLATARLKGLAANTVYRYRVIAENAISRKEGKPTEGERNGAGGEVVRTFTTQALGVFSLFDGRAWELVSPPDKHGALLKLNGVIQAASGGDAITYIASAPTESGSPGNSNQTQVLSTRAGSGGSLWGSRDISTPREVANGFQIGPTAEYKFFSRDLSLSIVQPFGLSSIEAGGGFYLRTDFSSVDPTDQCVNSCYQSLSHSAFAGASPDADHIILSSRAPLTEGAPSTESLYEWADGQFQLVSVLPNGEASTEGGRIGLRANFNSGEGVGRNAVSAVGSRVVWSTVKSLYLRDIVREETVQLGGANAQFQTANSDDTRVFFTVGGDLYVFEAPNDEALSSGHVTNLAPAGRVLGLVPGASQDGSTVYFVAESAIMGTEANQRGETAVAGQPNLYVEDGGVTRLVAVLSGKDEPDWLVNPLFLVKLGGLTSRVSPDGRWLAFMSSRSLTGYDNRDTSSGEPDQEVYLYDATADGGRGGLVCASCNPTGARPHGVDFGSKARFLVDGAEIWSGAHKQWIASNVPGWASPAYQYRYLSNTGRLFFNSDDALVPSDTNGTEDVYEYEPPGIGGCTNESVLFSARSGGCVDLVSSGVAREESAFLDASENGDDVFFLTSAQLSPLDTDSVPDVYDARVGGGIPPSTPPPACEGDACQSPVAAPNDQTPGSLTYQGPGNPVPLLTVSKTTKKALKCAKGKKLDHGKCVKTKSRKKVRKARKANRRAGNRGMIGRVGETGRTKS